MDRPGTQDHPLRIAIIGAGPAAFYAADQLIQQDDIVVQVDMFDRLPTPFGLVRGGVAPDHQKIKNVCRVYHKTAQRSGFRFFGNVEFGSHVMLDDLKRHYHQIFFATGAQTDRSLGIPGEDLAGSHSATEFVAWYNGHPDYRDCTFDLSAESVVIVGIGNVAVDVARILCRTPEELETTDIADYALDALRSSRVRNVHMLGRRGPLQAAFTPPEVKELGEMEDAVTVVRPDEAELDEISRELLEDADRNARRNVEIVQEFAHTEADGRSKRLYIRFLVSPVEILDDDSGSVRAVRIVRNELYRTEKGRVRPRPVDEYEVIDAGLIFRSVGYEGVALPDVPFNSEWNVILNEQGRVLDPASRQPITGLYVGGWIKRGPSGVIGTNKADSAETVQCMVEDLGAGRVLDPESPDAASAEHMIAEKQPQHFTYEDWCRIDELEIARGKELGRPRVKFTSVTEMWNAIEEVGSS